MAIFVRPVEPADLPRITDVLRASWGGTTVIALGRGELIDASALPGFVALAGADLAGLVTYTVAGDTVEIVTIDAVLPGQGVGSRLLDAVRRAATAGGAARIVLVTTNDNTGALRFYQRYGFDLVALRRNAVERARALKPGIPAESDGIPIRHELELELTL